MAKQSGLGDGLMVGGYEISCDIGSVGNVGGGPATLDMTGICKGAFERIGGVRDGRTQYTSFFNREPGRSHPVHAALPREDVLVTYHRGTLLGSPASALVARQLGYDGTRGEDGSFTFALDCQANGYGLEWGSQLTAGARTDEEPTEGDPVDLGTGPAEFGAQLYLHATALDGTDATVAVEHSPDGDVWEALPGGEFGEFTEAPGWQRIETARDATVQRYLRATSSGTFTELAFAVIAVRNEVEVVF